MNEHTGARVELEIHVDGGARGNPGPAGAGITIRQRDGDLVFEAAYFLGNQTNNAAEYQALIRALEQAHRAAARSVTVYSDSELLVRQLTGEYQVKSPRLAELYMQAQRMLLKIPRWSVRHVRREQNQRADELANLAMDRQTDVIVFDRSADPADAASSAQQAPAPDAKPATGSPGPQEIRVNVAEQPRGSTCPAGGVQPEAFTITSELPGNLCVHAAHAILPTVLAMLATDPHEFNSVPTLTVRCSRPECGAVFKLSPAGRSNGRQRST